MLLALSALLAFAQEPPGVDWGAVLASGVEGEVLAVVDGLPVTVAEWQARASRRPDDPREQLLDEIVAEKLVLLAALRGGALSDPKVQKVLVNTQLRAAVYADVRNTDFTEADLLAYWEAHSDEFAVPEKRNIKRIFVADAKGARKRVKELYEQLTADPARFADLASEVSEDPYRRRGGDIGYVSREGKPGIPEEVVAVAWSLEVGGLSKPFEAGGGWNLVMVANQRERVERTFEQMKGSVLRKMKNDRYKALYEAYVDALRVDARVETWPGRLEALEIPERSGVQVSSPDGAEPDAE